MGKADIKIWQKKKRQDLPTLSNFLQRKAASSGEVLSVSVSPPSGLPFLRQWQGARDSGPILLVDPPAGKSLPHLFLGPWLCPLHHLWGCSSSYRVSGSGLAAALNVVRGDLHVLTHRPWGVYSTPSARQDPASMYLGTISEEMAIPGDYNGDFVIFCPLPDPSVGSESLGVFGILILFQGPRPHLPLCLSPSKICPLAKHFPLPLPVW